MDRYEMEQEMSCMAMHIEDLTKERNAYAEACKELERYYTTKLDELVTALERIAASFGQDYMREIAVAALAKVGADKTVEGE